MNTKDESLPVQGNEEPFVYFDLETGGLNEGEDILQIAAVCDDRSYMRYVTPTKPVSPGATNVNKLTNQDGVLMKIVSQEPLQMEKLETLPIKEALQKFLTWLDTIGPCYLVGHNVAFDKKHLTYHATQSRLTPEVNERILGYIDTLKFFRNLHPEFYGNQGHKLETLVHILLGETFGAHDALQDVKALHKLVKNTDVTRETLLRFKLTWGRNRVN